jgi:hypothetical protein
MYTSSCIQKGLYVWAGHSGIPLLGQIRKFETVNPLGGILCNTPLHINALFIDKDDRHELRVQ